MINKKYSDDVQGYYIILSLKHKMLSSHAYLFVYGDIIKMSTKTKGDRIYYKPGLLHDVCFYKENLSTVYVSKNTNKDFVYGLYKFFNVSIEPTTVKRYPLLTGKEHLIEKAIEKKIIKKESDINGRV